MTILIYEEHGASPVETWEEYPFIPNVGDRVFTTNSGLKTVVCRVFRKDAIHIRIK